MKVPVVIECLCVETATALSYVSIFGEREACKALNLQNRSSKIQTGMMLIVRILPREHTAVISAGSVL